jgi:predicted nuclease of predicted toxin-antitoxin system
MSTVCQPTAQSSGGGRVILWIDAQLSLALALWISDTFDGVAAHAVRDLGLREAKDLAIFHAAREAGAVIMSKDSDFVLLLERFGPPPQILWVTCGNNSNARLRDVLHKSFPEAIAHLEQGELLVEISDSR